MDSFDWRAVRELLALRARLKDVVEQAIMPASPEVLSDISSFQPPADIWETSGEIVIEVELPGLAARELDLRLEGDTLILSGQLPPADEPGSTYLRIERPRGRFSRTLNLPVPATGAPVATLDNGVLEIRVPTATARRRRVAVVQETP
jgi:HSP20 family protein